MKTKPPSRSTIHDRFGDVPERLGRYRIEMRIGGGMGSVYRARDESLDRTVAIKYFRAQSFDTDDLRRRFRREARAVAQLSHPAIVQVFDFVQEEEHDWLVMEYVRGATLAKTLADGPLEVASALPILREIAHGLAEAHRKNVVHRDVKTDNVMITESGHVKLLDFGLARRTLVENPQDAHLTTDGMILGTPHAMSPEQGSGLTVDARSDIFSFGSLMYEVLTGESPFRIPNPVQTLLRVLSHLQEPAARKRPAIPQELSDLIDKMLEKEPERRPQEVLEVGRFLDRMVGSEISTYIRLAVRERENLANEPTPTPRPEAGGEGVRRRVTVLDGELVGPAAEDPRILFRIRPEIRRLTSEVLGEQDGAIVRLSDRGFVAVFGYPDRRGDESRRAILAARQILRRMEHLTAELGEEAAPGLEMRLGVHAGSVVSADGHLGDDASALGATGQRAAALACRARRGDFLVSEAVHEGVAAYFQCTLDEASPSGDGPRAKRAYRIVGDRV